MANSGKINAAARALGLTPPAVTLQIQQAEAAAGTPLFERSGSGFEPTDAGRAVLAAARDIDRRMTLLADEVAAIRGATLGTLRLGAVSTAKYFTPALIAGFAAAHPGIDVRLTVGNRAAIIAALKSKDIDIALMGRPPRQAEVDTLLVGPHPLVIVAAPDHPLAAVAVIPKRRIAGEHFLVREPGSGTRMALELFFGDIPGRLDAIGTEFNSNETIKQAVMARLGIALISAHTIALELELGRLAILDVADTPIERQWFAVSEAGRRRSPAMEVFRGFIGDRGADYLPKVSSAGDTAN